MLVLFGGNGFIGRHLSILAHRLGISTTIVTRATELEFLASYAPSAIGMPLAQFEGDAGDELLRGRASSLIYLASRSVPGSHHDQPSAEISQNVAPALNTFLRVARLRPNLPIVFLSSGGTVYGRIDCTRIPETAPTRPISPYGLGKVMIEQCLRFCGDTAGQRYAILRASNAIGRWHRRPDQGLVMAAMRAINSGTPLPIYGDGTAVRDYLDADDLAEAIITVARSEPKAGLWNVGSGVGHSVLDIVDMVEEVTGKRPRIEFRPNRGIDVPHAVLDPSKIFQDFGWKAKTPLLLSLKKALSDQSTPG